MITSTIAPSFGALHYIDYKPSARQKETSGWQHTTEIELSRRFGTGGVHTFEGEDIFVGYTPTRLYIATPNKQGKQNILFRFLGRDNEAMSPLDASITKAVKAILKGRQKYEYFPFGFFKPVGGKAVDVYMGNIGSLYETGSNTYSTYLYHFTEPARQAKAPVTITQ